MDDLQTDAQPRSDGALLDALERALVREFGLVSARARARELLGDEARAAAQARVERARAARSEAIARNVTLEEIAEAGDREQEAQAVVERLAGWRARERTEATLAVEVLTGARALGPAADPRWWPDPSDASAGASEGDGDPGPRPVYLREPKLRICGHFEPEVDLLIHDHELGTLGMVQIVDASARGSVREQVSRYVDRATYLRHLLLTARDEHGSHDRQIVSVELVLVHRAGDGDGDGQVDLLYEVGEILRDLALETNCLHAIGINVLAGAGDHQGFARADLRRAFAWLLHDSRRWFGSLEQRRRAAEVEAGSRFDRLRAIELDEYRLPGERTLELAPDTRLHLLHGHNGSGKSSLVEALELMLTGSIERLAGIEDYEHVVRNRWAQTPARIVLHPADPTVEPIGFELHGGDRPEQPLAPGSRAASFRLDQTVMDRLARASDVDRAAELLAAFFSDEAEVRERWQQAVADAEGALARLPARVQAWLEHRRLERQDLHEVVVEQLAGLADERIGAELFDALLPLPRAELRPLHSQIPALAELDERLERDGWLATDDELLERLDAGFEALGGDLDGRVSTVEAVLRTLERAGRWWQEGEAGGFASEADYAAALDEWLELTALVDLAEQQRRVLAILHGAKLDGWDDRRLDQAGSAAALLRQLAAVEAEQIRDLERARELWAKRRDQLGRALRTSGGKQGEDKPVAAARVRLDEDEVDELDRFGRWWAPGEAGEGLGRRIRAAVEGGEAHSFAGVDIGAQAWVRPLQDAAARLLAPLRTLQQAWRQTTRASGRELARRHTSPPSPAAAVSRSAKRRGGDQPVPAAPSAPPTQEEPEEKPLEIADDEDAGEALDGLGSLAGADADDDDAAPDTEDWLGVPPARSGATSAPGAPPRSAPATPQAKLIPLTDVPLRGALAEPEPEPESESEVGGGAGLEAEPEIEPERRPDLASDLALRERGVGRAEPAMELGLAALVERLSQAHAVSLAAREVGARVQDSFVARLAARDERALGLVDALNELMALFTPARWAYEDVVLRYEQDGEISRLQFETGDIRSAESPEGWARARADLRLNTAQLNAFTLALFLLCAPRVDNPIGLLVLDDPLQNMDELTVTTLARGLAKLLRVMPERWSLMMLFHGEGDLARFHDEVECGVYFLPWLSPTARGRAITIGCRREDSRLGLTIQAIDDLFALRP